MEHSSTSIKFETKHIHKMVKTMKKFIIGITILALAVLIAMPVLAFNNDKHVSEKIQVTTAPKYDRNSEILRANDGTYWLFYTTGKDNRGIRDFQGYNPDLDYYDIYFRTSRSVEGLQNVNDGIIRLPYPDNAQRDVAAVQTSDGKIWLFASTGLGPGAQRSIYYYIYDGTWSGPTAIPNTDYAAHMDAILSNGKIWVFFDIGYALKVTSYDGSIWSTPVDIHSDATVARAIGAGGTLYVVWTTSSGTGIYLSTSTDGNTWTSTSTPIASWPGASTTNWDPVLIKDGNVFRLFWAPDIVTGQFIATATSTNPKDPASWSTPVKLTTANNWWDYWPQPVTKDGSIYLFYTSERNMQGTARTDANIWMLKLSG
jgi:hypothetical protein